MNWGYISNFTITIIYCGIHLLEAMGFIVIITAALRAFWEYCTIKDTPLFQYSRLRLAEGMADGLAFKLAGEILRTMLVQSWEEIVIVGSIIVLRAIMTLMIHWEIRHEKLQD